eukprot:TRINITY_DN1667_c0_g1_i1.p1 TRINITY_DN1667_c0_g1~~TRINITY_DN1667_c0_g1_i1.p1  ORF type:complete len:423 (-),score=64.89 TRINITY_DN1667_c0_g1_i1:851-2119(-)
MQASLVQVLFLFLFEPLCRCFFFLGSLCCCYIMHTHSYTYTHAFCAFALCLVVVSALSSSIPSAVIVERSEEDIHNEFSRFKATHMKLYGSKDEEAYRKEVFRNTLTVIDAHNANPDRTYDMGINQFSDLTKEEFKALQTLRHSQSPLIHTVPAPLGDSGNAENVRGSWPSSVNWVTAGRVGAVRNQGQCGSCWAFAAIATMESAKAIQEDTNVIEDLSEQMLVDCDTYDSACGGGFYTRAFQFLKNNNKGAVKESDYPYVGVQQTCTYDSKSEGQVYVSDYKEYSMSRYDLPTSYNSMMEAIQERPVAIALYSGPLQTYSSGILSYASCGDSNNPDHAVTLVGYGSDNGNDYWLVRNSWGAGWGEQGYFRLQRSSSANTCNMFAWEVAYPIVSNTPGSMSAPLHMFLASIFSIVLCVLFIL